MDALSIGFVIGANQKSWYHVSHSSNGTMTKMTMYNRMSKIDDVVFTVKGKTVSTPSLKGLPKDVSAEALKRFKILGSAVAGFTKGAAKMPPTVAAIGGAGGPSRSRSPSPKPASKKSPGLAAAENQYGLLQEMAKQPKKVRDDADFQNVVKEHLESILFHRKSIPAELIIKAQKLVKKIIGRSGRGEPMWEKVLTAP